MMLVLFLICVIGIPMTIMIYTERGKKRGCGRGCATCGNREICHKRRKKSKQEL